MTPLLTGGASGALPGSGGHGIASTGGSAGGVSTGGAANPTGGTAGAVSTGGAQGGIDAGGTAGVGDGGSEPDAAGPMSCTEDPGSTAHFSFFVTSLRGLQRLSDNQNGFGGDLRFGFDDGLSGADEICRRLAEDSFPSAGCKTWRAFLSVTSDVSGAPVNAIDRVGDGPWYDRLGRLVAMNRVDLVSGRWPVGADPAIAMDLPNEDGIPNQNPDGMGQQLNHHTLTGSRAGGLLASTDWRFTCHDWTSSVGTDGQPAFGWSWEGGGSTLGGWHYGAQEAGCAAAFNVTTIIPDSNLGVGSFGGYGGFYCLALEP